MLDPIVFPILDQLSEMASGIRKAETLLLPSIAPEWRGFDIAFAQHKGTNVSGVYYDFFLHENHQFAALCAEPLDKGIESILYTSVLRGMAKSLFSQEVKADKFLEKLNTMLCNDSINQKFQYAYLFSSEDGQSIHYSSSRQCSLWLIEKQSEQPIPLVSKIIFLGDDGEFSSTEKTPSATTK